MIQIKRVVDRSTSLGVAATLILAALVPVLAVRQSSALALVDRSLMVTSTAESDDNIAPDGSTYTFGSGVGEVPAGDPRNGTKVGHVYTFSPESADDLEGFTIEYCTTAFAYVSAPDTACTGPTGFSASAWAGASITVTNVTNANDTEVFTAAVPSANYIELTSATALPVDANDQLTISFDGASLNENDYFVNPTTTGTYFATVSTYAQDSEAQAGTPVVDLGTVTNSTTESISVYTRVQETLNFSVEGDEAADGATPAGGSCTPLSEDGLINMGDSNNALDPTVAYEATSYFRLSTNSAYGTNVYYSGDTLKSGSNDINALTDAAGVASTTGSEQFGLAIDTTTPMTGLATVDGAYDNAQGNEFAYDTGSVANPQQIASSAGIVSCDTAQVDYVANIATNTPAGIYTTKINYIASPSY